MSAVTTVENFTTFCSYSSEPSSALHVNSNENAVDTEQNSHLHYKPRDPVARVTSVLHSSLHHVNVICCDNKCINKKALR